MSSFARAYHCENEEFPVFSDTVARKLMTDDEYNMISNYVLGGISFFAPEKKDTFKDEKDALRYLVNTHLAPTVLCRSAYCEKALKTLSEIMSDGSEIVFDYADSNLFMSKEKRVQNMIAMAKAGGEEMKSSFSYMSMELMLSDLGFLVYEHLTPSVIQKEIIKNADMKAFEHINYVLAVKKM